jgi:hypothetical protein
MKCWMQLRFKVGLGAMLLLGITAAATDAISQEETQLPRMDKPAQSQYLAQDQEIGETAKQFLEIWLAKRDFVRAAGFFSEQVHLDREFQNLRGHEHTAGLGASDQRRVRQILSGLRLKLVRGSDLKTLLSTRLYDAKDTLAVHAINDYKADGFVVIRLEENSPVHVKAMAEIGASLHKRWMKRRAGEVFYFTPFIVRIRRPMDDVVALCASWAKEGNDWRIIDFQYMTD